MVSLYLHSRWGTIKMGFTNEQTERYSRQIVLSGVGVKGQRKLLDSKVLVIGAGGLGSSAAMFLAATGIGMIGLVDNDVVDLSNLQRQIIHSTHDVGKLKVISGKETINELNPDVKVVTYQEWVSSKNIADIIEDQDYEFIIDATDNFSSKLLINDACVLLHKPFSHAGVGQYWAQTMTYVPDIGPCYRCAFSDPQLANAVPTYTEVGVLSSLPGIIGTIQATEAIKYLLGIGDLLTGHLLLVDVLSMAFTKVELSLRQDCEVCGEQAKIKELFDYE